MTFYLSTCDLVGITGSTKTDLSINNPGYRCALLIQFPWQK